MAKAKVMIVDDSPLILDVVGGTLRSAGYEVVCRSVPVGTGAAILRERPALVLMDVSMPLVEGTEISESLRSSRMTHGSVIVLHSDRPAAELSELAQQCGADGYIRKTGDTRELLTQVSRWISARPRSTQGRPRAVLVAGSPATKERVAAVLATDVSLQFTESGAEAYRVACSRSAPRVVVLDASLTDLRAPSLWQRLVDAEPNWRQQILVVDDGVKAPIGWPDGVTWVTRAGLRDALARAVERG